MLFGNQVLLHVLPCGEPLACRNSAFPESLRNGDSRRGATRSTSRAGSPRLASRGPIEAGPSRWPGSAGRRPFSTAREPWPH